MSTVIKVENLSKSYRLGSISTGSLHKDLQSFWARVRGKEDPNRRIGEAARHQTKDGLFWALKNVSFEVQQGQVLGILGRNGAGKSTLLKILSRITAPTQGSVKIRGRIASLLEVGTGFHPELTGRENVYLNGAILGMTRREIDRKFDEIVDFAEIEQFIDTPVKRYSSGMYVRLAFAVAAHLDPEILIVDEVLAVGDAQFQNKCLGKMGQVGKEGKTILFVSHNMAAMKTLCNNGVLLKDGMVTFNGGITETISEYLETGTTNLSLKGVIPDQHKRYNTGQARIREVKLLNRKGEPASSLLYGEAIKISILVEVLVNLSDVVIDVKITTLDGMIVTNNVFPDHKNKNLALERGRHEIEIYLQNPFLPDNYNMDVGIHHANGTTIDFLKSIYDFEILRIGIDADYELNWKHGYVRLNADWKVM